MCGELSNQTRHSSPLVMVPFCETFCRKVAVHNQLRPVRVLLLHPSDAQRFRRFRNGCFGAGLHLLSPERYGVSV